MRNMLPAVVARRSLTVRVLDANGRATLAGAEVRVYAAGTRKLVGTRWLDTGSGYDAQNDMPVHIGLTSMLAVDVEVTTLTGGKRTVTVSRRVLPATYAKRWLTIRVAIAH